VIAPPAVAERASPPRFFMAVGGGVLEGMRKPIRNEQLADYYLRAALNRDKRIILACVHFGTDGSPAHR